MFDLRRSVLVDFNCTLVDFEPMLLVLVMAAVAVEVVSSTGIIELGL
jgi:hypothetical protein